MASYSDILFGKIALKNKLITPAQLLHCAGVMERSRGMTLAEALVREGALSPRKARKVQKAQALSQFVRAEKIFARIALERRLVDVATLEACFRRQAELGYRARLGQLLVEQRRIGAEQVEEIVEEQLLRLAEDTARIEEGGFGEEPVEGDPDGRRLDEISQVGAATDLEGSTLRKAIGPRGMLSREAIHRTLPAFVVPQLEEARPAQRPAGGGPVPPDEVEIDDEDDESLGGSGSRATGRPLPPSRPLDPTNLVGATIASRYRVLEKVGEGGMGTVYRAEHCLMEKTVALKVLHPSLVGSKLSLERFRQEIRAASRFQHKNVVQIYDAGASEGGLFYMAMEFAAGETLEALLQRGPLPLPRAMRILRQVLLGVAEAHKKGIVHRDLKSGNIMIVPDRAVPDLVKVMDFGLAKIALESSEGALETGRLMKTQEGVVTGTPQYMSPEQASGEPLDHRSDLYSLGVIVFEMLTGELPFKSNTPMGYLGKHIVEPPPRPGEVAPGQRIPRALEDVVLRLLAKRPAERYQDAEEVLRALEAALEGRGSGRLPAPVVPARGGEGPFARPPGGATTRDAPPENGSGRQKVPPAPTPARAAARPDGRSGRIAREAEARTGGEAARGEAARGGEAPRSGRAPRQEGRSERTAPRSPEPPRGAPEPEHELARTIVAPPPEPVVPVAGPAARPWRLLVGLLLLFALTLGASIGLAVHFGKGSDDDGAATLERARAHLERGELDQALALLDPLLAAHPELAAARELQARAGQERHRAALIAEADRQAAEFRAGTSAGAAAEKAVRLYRDALALRPDPEVRARLEALEAGLSKQPLPPPDSDPLARQRTALEDALQARRLDEAERLLEALGGALAAQQQLVYAAHLQAERQVEQAGRLRAAGRTQQAVELLEEARQKHPVRERRAELEQELQALRAAQEGAALRERVSQAGARGREAALRLDRAGLQTALEELRAATGQLPEGARAEAERVAAALESAGPLLDDVRALRAELDRLDGADPVPGAEAGAAVERAAALRTRAQALEGAPELARELDQSLSRDERRAAAVAARARSAPTPTPVNQGLERLLAALEKVKAEPLPALETPEAVLQRLDRVRQLESYPGWESAQPEPRAWVKEELARLIRRQQVWAELGDGFRLIPGGEWRSPADKQRVHQLPSVYYAAATELSCAAWNEFLRATSTPRPPGFPGPTNEPVTNITLSQAKRYCDWRSQGLKRVRFRLPSEAEWERAARGPDGLEHPWGDTFEPWRAKDVALDRLAPVGETPKDENGFRLRDVVGNACELTATVRPGGMVVIKGGGVGVPRQNARAGSVQLAREGSEAAPNVGLRLFAEELP